MIQRACSAGERDFASAIFDGQQPPIPLKIGYLLDKDLVSVYWLSITRAGTIILASRLWLIRRSGGAQRPYAAQRSWRARARAATRFIASTAGRGGDWTRAPPSRVCTERQSLLRGYLAERKVSRCLRLSGISAMILG
jgi:hypothetical protein